MESKLAIFVNSEGSPIEELIQLLNEKLKRKTQIEHYDTVYRNFINNNPNNTSLEVRIPGLSYMIKLCIFASYYRKELYPTKQGTDNSDKCKEYLESLLDDERVVNDDFNEITFETTIYRILISLQLNDDEFKYYTEEMIEKGPIKSTQADYLLSPEELKLKYEMMYLKGELKKLKYERVGDLIPKNIIRYKNNVYEQYINYKTNEEYFMTKPSLERNFFKYIIFGKAAITRIDDLCDGFFLYDTVKLFIAANLYTTTSGAHNGAFDNDFTESYLHDFNHSRAVINSFESKELNEKNKMIEYYKTFSEFRSGFDFKYICMMFFWNVFEGLFVTKITDELLFDPLSSHETNDDNYYPRDVYYCIKWIISAYDIDQELLNNVNTLLEKYAPKIFRFGPRANFQKVISLLVENFKKRYNP